MTWIWTTLILIAWGLLLATMVYAFLDEDTCPECGSDNIESVDLKTSTIEIDGETTPAAWMYRKCHDCGAKLKWDIGQDQWVQLEEGEWDEVVHGKASS